MKALCLLFLGWLLSGVPDAQEARANRIWWAAFELQGPLQGLSVDCGADGATRLRAELRAGETRALDLPLPLLSPLGASGLSAIPFELKVQGAGSARFLAWRDPQPSQRFERLGSGLRSRSRPPAGPSTEPMGAAPLAFLGVALVLIWAARKRWLLCLALASLGAAGLFGLALGMTPPAGGVQVIEIDMDAEQAFVASSGWERLKLPQERLELWPARAPMLLEVELNGAQLSGVVRAEDCVVVSLERTDFVAYTPKMNPGPDLDAVWLRSSDGEWSFHGPWPLGQALGPAQHDSSAPPSWLLSGPAPASGALIARLAGSEKCWIRVLGLNPR